MMLNERYGKSRREQYTTWFHGTSVDRLPSILSAGLTAKVKKRAWHDDPHANLSTPSRASYGGVYLTRNLGTAKQAAWHASGNDYHTQFHKGKHRAVVMVSAHPRSLVADEDSLTGVLTSSFDHRNSAHFARDMYLRHHHGSAADREFVDQHRQNFANKVAQTLSSRHKSLAHPEAQKRIKELAYHGWPAVLHRAASHVASSEGPYHDMHWKSAYANVKNDQHAYDHAPPAPTPEEGEKAFRHFTDKLTRTVSGIVPRKDSDERFVHGRSLHDIGFSGKRKITGIVTIGKPNRKEFAQIKKIAPKSAKYHEVVRPVVGDIHPDFVKEWHTGTGGNLFVSRNGRVKVIKRT